MRNPSAPTGTLLSTRKLPVFVAACLAVVLLVAACGGGSGASDEPANVDNTSSTIGRGEEFGMTEAELVVRIEAVEDLIGSCMSGAGFEYVPLDATSVRAAMDALGTVATLSDEEYVAQFGYGLSTDFENLGVQTIFGEQNVQIFGGLAEDDQVAYLRTLLGEDTDATFVFTLDDEDFSSTGGCTRTAVEQQFSLDELSPSYFNPIDALVDADPRLIAARAAWATCMREDGFDYGRQEDAEDDISDRFDEITGGEDPDALVGSTRDALLALQGEERAIALRDFECSEEHYDDVEEEVEDELIGA